jgi:hypothetical protein
MEAEILYPLIALISAIGLDWLLGIALALKDRTFKWGLLPETLRANVLPYLLPLGALAGLATLEANAALAGFFYAFSAAYSAKLLADIAQKVERLTGVKP